MMKTFISVRPDGSVDSFYQRNADDPALVIPGMSIVELVGPTVTGFGGQPSASHTLYWTAAKGLHWLETATLAELKVRKRAQITADRLAADADKFVYQTKQIRTAEKDIFDLLIADARMKKGWPPNWPGGWKAMDDTYLMIGTIAEWDAFFIAMYDAGIANFQKSQNLKANISAATTAEQVAAIQWNQPTEAV